MAVKICLTGGPCGDILGEPTPSEIERKFLIEKGKGHRPAKYYKPDTSCSLF